jgi:endonuclease YncB( thermonuclease family)
MLSLFNIKGVSLKAGDELVRWLMKFAAVLLIAIASTAHAAEKISGVPHIVDGDTLVIGNTKIRLASIDAPESDQVCLDANRKHWTCGIEATSGRSHWKSRH